MRYRHGVRGRLTSDAHWATTGLGLVLARPAPAAPTPLIGTFTITAGSCHGSGPSGTYLRMVLSGGRNAAGPYFSNSDSSCHDNSDTPLAPGTAGGLVTGSYQSQPAPAFDSSGNALPGQITAPVAFEGVKFATATNAVDPQTGLHAPSPSITADGTALSGNLESFGVSWNNQEFNQGSPKPGGASPGNTTPVVGTYNPASGAYTLQWSNQVVGGPFHGFSAFWNLTGRFIPSGASSVPATASAGSPAAGSGPAPATSSGPATAAGSTSTTSTVPAGTAGAASTPAASGTTGRSHVALSSRTVTSGGGGWHSPGWLVVLVIVLGLIGLAGVLWSEQALRRQRLQVEKVEGCDHEPE
jgi:hypothetical protein